MKFIAGIVLALTVMVAGIGAATAAQVRHVRYLVVVDFCTHHPAWPSYSRVHYRVFSQGHATQRSAAMFNHYNVAGIMPVTYGQVSGVIRIEIAPDGTVRMLDRVGYVRFNNC